MATEQIRDLYNTVTEQRRLQSMSKEQYAQKLIPRAAQIFEAANAHARPTPEGTELVAPDGVVINTKRVLIKYVNSAPDATKSSSKETEKLYLSSRGFRIYFK